MLREKPTTLKKDLANKKIYVEREFAAPVEKIWKAWTDKDILDQWWAPKPWKAHTKFMDFREGGYWLYSMEGPDGSKSWSRADYKTIDQKKSFSAVDGFSDEQGVINKDMPVTSWKVEFIPAGQSTKVKVEMSFEKEDDLKRILDMGFEAGFSSGHDNLDDLISQGKI